MRAGPLRHRLVIEQDIGGDVNDIGGRDENWQTYKTLRGSIAFKGGKEHERAKQITADLTHLFKIRYQSGIDTNALHAMRIRDLDDGSIYRIHYAVDPDHRKRSIHLHASESQST